MTGVPPYVAAADVGADLADVVSAAFGAADEKDPWVAGMVTSSQIQENFGLSKRLNPPPTAR